MGMIEGFGKELEGILEEGYREKIEEIEEF